MSDPATVQAAINIVTGIVAAAVCVAFAWQWRADAARLWLALVMAFLCAYGAAAYSLVLFVDTAVNVALLRWTLSAWHVVAVSICLLARTLEVARFDFQCQERVKELEAQMKTRLQNELDQQKTIRLYRAEVARLEMLVGDLNNQILGMTAEMRSLREELERG